MAQPEPWRTTHYIGPTKGSHLVLDNPELRQAIGDHEFFFENKDGRIVLIFPLFDKVMIGTSDLPIKDPDDVHCTDEEVQYFIELVGRVFPNIKVSHSISFFVSRAYGHWNTRRPTIPTRSRVTTTFRKTWPVKSRSTPWSAANGPRWAFSEQVTDKALAFLGMPRKTETTNLPIGKGEAAAAQTGSCLYWRRDRRDGGTRKDRPPG